MHSSIIHTETPISRSDVARAYQAGDLALRDRRITPPGHMLYEVCLDLSKQKGYAWVKETTLASMLSVSVRTIRRWMAQLVDAQLIVRVRRFGASALSQITAWRRDETPPDDQDTSGLTIRTDLAAVNDLKDLNPIDQGGGAAAIPEPILVTGDEPETEPPAAAVELLTAAGLEDPPTIHRLASYPIERIREVIGQVKRQRATPGLVQHKLDHGGGRARVPSDGFIPRSKAGQVPPVPKVEDYLYGYCAGCCEKTYGNCPCWIGPMPEGQP